jgi:hypothetical protein
VYVFFSAKFNFTVSYFDLYLYSNVYNGNKEIMNSNKEVYSVLKFTVLFHVIVLLLLSCSGVSERETV